MAQRHNIEDPDPERVCFCDICVPPFQEEPEKTEKSVEETAEPIEA